MNTIQVQIDDFVTAGEFAGKRTKNRISEHPQLVPIRVANVVCFGTSPIEALFTACICHPDNSWTGWFSTDEIKW